MFNERMLGKNMFNEQIFDKIIFDKNCLTVIVYNKFLDKNFSNKTCSIKIVNKRKSLINEVRNENQMLVTKVIDFKKFGDCTLYIQGFPFVFLIHLKFEIIRVQGVKMYKC